MKQKSDPCVLCPRQCKADRDAETVGVCGEKRDIKVARAALHMWEEPCLSGKEGSGAVFFSGCTLKCVYCQNSRISTGGTGQVIRAERLAEIFLELQDKNANNINLVTPTHFVPQIVEAIKCARVDGLSIPIVYNTSGYERVETLRMLEGLVDIYLPDFKYLDAEHAGKYSKAWDYPDVVKQAIREMVRQQPECIFDEQGMMKAGVIVRHLLLPGCLLDARRIITYLHETYQDRIYLSLMNQYTPMESLDIEKYPELNQKVSRKAYKKLIDHAIQIGVVNAFIQEGETAKESFIPAFDLEGVLPE